MNYYINASEKQNICASYLIHLIKSALDDTTPQSKPSKISYCDILNLAKIHNVVNLTYYSLNKLDEKIDDGTNKEFREINDKNIRIAFNQINERNKIAKALSDNGIKVLFFKGSLLIEDYPQEDFRQMGDLDFYVDRNDAYKVKDILKSLGYENEYFGATHHDAYTKKFIYLEVHYQLLDRKEDCHSYYDGKDLFKNAISYLNEKNVYKLNINDHFIFLIAHFSEHFYTSGSGIRFVCDIAQYLRIYKKKLDFKYISNEIEKMGLFGFYEDMLAISDMWFEHGQYSEALLPSCDIILRSGIFGSTEMWATINFQKAKNEHPHSAKLHYILNTIFPGEEVLVKYPFYNKHRILYPIFVVDRAIKLSKNSKEKLKAFKNELKGR